MCLWMSTRSSPVLCRWCFLEPRFASDELRADRDFIMKVEMPCLLVSRGHLTSEAEDPDWRREIWTVCVCGLWRHQCILSKKRVNSLQSLALQSLNPKLGPKLLTFQQEWRLAGHLFTRIVVFQHPLSTSTIVGKRADPLHGLQPRSHRQS